MTDKNYRRKGLCDFLLKKIISDWENNSDGIYLFANDSSIALYPKYEFKKIHEYQCSKQFGASQNTAAVKQLDMTDENHRAMLYHYAKSPNPYSQLTMVHNADLVMFYCTYFFKDCVYFIEEIDTIIIAKVSDTELQLFDIFSQNVFDLDTICQLFAKKNIKRIVFGFTPINADDCEMSLKSSDETLFVLEGNENLFDKRKLMFPVLSHA